ncbi:(2Fe-2S)-binding protein [Bradyrhizobium neotropicale]|uniref:(2Fe-2S)-binding protein n=1 Tax=Bradyrhizobium neotropicale TaxID=1497615 RepID=UPI001AD61591|nr:(2Fe-2S)-binding protein [Bradyrhizobium neotropicale]MBO4226839.1 2Fe-2S iron-sulfur cluster binding domain-containing protein [Bradyrhizobium neotropicale]
MAGIPIQLVVNGESVARTVEPRTLLSDFLRQDLGLTGTHVGCEHGVCGACTVLVDGRAARSCLMFAAQADGAKIETVEGLAKESGALSPLQEAFREAHGLQCGFCTPGMLMTASEYLRNHGSPDRQDIREAISGNLCRCTGYETVVDAIAKAARRQAEERQ